MTKSVKILGILLGGITLLLWFPGAMTAQKDMPATSFHKEAIACNQCHVCELPTETDPCLPACPRPRFEEEISTGEIPETVVIDRLENIYGPTYFNHKEHADMSGMGEGCGACHFHYPPGHVYGRCQDCHSLEANAENLGQPSLKAIYHRSCMACHMEWSHDKNCVVCHAKKGEETAEGTAGKRYYSHVQEPEKKVWDSDEFDKGTKVTFFHKNHIDLYGLTCTKCHQNETCRNCHDKGEPRYKFARDADAFHDMCNQCHGKRSCEWCHRTEEIAAFTHAAWPLNRYHKPLSCAKCHKTKGKFKGLSRRCEACHSGWSTANFNHAKITGVGLDEIHLEMDCGDCHMDRNFARKPTCDACHDDGRAYPASKPGP